LKEYIKLVIEHVVGKHWALIVVEVEILNELATQSANYISE
jgi:hypothetical protein